MKLIVNNLMTVNIDLPKRLSPRQKLFIKHLSNPQRTNIVDMINNLTRYAASFQGQASDLRLGRLVRTNGDNDELANRQKNHFLRQALRIYHPDSEKTPKLIAKGDAIGVEIECIMPHAWSRDRVGDEVARLKIKNVNVKHDGSICDFNDNDHYALEFTIITDIKDLSNLEALCTMIKNMGGFVNKTCGLHVHLDQRDTQENIDASARFGERPRHSEVAWKRANKLEWSLPILTRMLPKSRNVNQRYCRHGQSPNPENHDHRYYMINTVSLNQHGTIEVRAHSGTTNFRKIKQWIEICYAASRATGERMRGLPAITDKESFKFALAKWQVKVKLSAENVEYIKARVKLFNPQLFETAPADRTELEESEDLPVMPMVYDDPALTASNFRQVAERAAQYGSIDRDRVLREIMTVNQIVEHVHVDDDEESEESDDEINW